MSLFGYCQTRGSLPQRKSKRTNSSRRNSLSAIDILRKNHEDEMNRMKRQFATLLSKLGETGEPGTSHVTMPIGESDGGVCIADEMECAVDITFEVMQVDEEKELETVAEEASEANSSCTEQLEQQLEQQRKTIADLTRQNALKDVLLTQTRAELQQTGAVLAVLQQKLAKVASLALKPLDKVSAKRRRHSMGMIQLQHLSHTRSKSASNLLIDTRPITKLTTRSGSAPNLLAGMSSLAKHRIGARSDFGGYGRGERVFSVGTPERPFARWDSDALCFLKKLGDRDVEGGDRIRAMDVISSGIRRGESEYVALLDHEACVRRLLFGMATELLDAEQQVQRVAAELAPGLLDECVNVCAGNQNADVVYENLPSIFDNLFRVLDDPQSKANHGAVQRGVDTIVANMLDRRTHGSPVDDAVTYLLCAHLYAI